MSLPPEPIRRVLYLQKTEVLAQQQALVTRTLQTAIPAAEITFADSIKAVPLHAEVDVVITPTLPWLPDALARLRSYRWLHFLSAGVEKIWSMDFDKSSIWMTKSSGVHGPPMSEYAIGAMLYFTKQFGCFHDQARQALWQRRWLGELTGSQLTVLGLGHIGQCLAQRAKAFDMHVVGTQRSPRQIAGVDRVVAIEDIGPELARTDFLVVCLPLTQATHGVVNSELLAQLQPGAVLIDISRGGVVKSDSVISALDAGTLKGAALDVFEQQPLPADSPLWKRSDLLITPHVSGTTPFYLERALGVFIENLRAYQQGNSFTTAVNIDAGY
ncbi:D-2-hydroxyacid dehydrogenase [Halomonas sp. ANAO-440]|uniref:D-2-hydroxyacid dehydrogenase n=1 Tax=Halomonas sp. ANAO-440 TaxID=2861360 RepID=UPI001CAA4F5F|nr:D-2-hydroxyacid dehydrogenase [Halomonas sp. ANAO-440]MBZ0329205.1 D-2-hydroxyacid dehydrogenase [Halomonas sp. ANAO-440]